MVVDGGTKIMILVVIMVVMLVIIGDGLFWCWW